MVAVWGEVFVALWDRRNAELTFSWGVMEWDAALITQELAKEVRGEGSLAPRRNHSCCSVSCRE